ncbi:MAG: hypothetical protein WAK48_05935, partial [Candidatus Acidiferrum sp.]
MSATGALIDMTAECGGTTSPNGQQHFDVLPTEPVTISFAPDTFRDEGLYAFRFDTDRDLREDVTFKVQFGPPAHADGGEHRHVQTFAVRRATGADALKGAAGELI